MKNKLSPSMMCADPARLKETLAAFEAGGIEYLHIDIMDGHFVPNFALSGDYCKALKRLTNIPLDIHLMVEAPEDKLDWFEIGAGDIVSVHAESTARLRRALTAIRAKGALALAALRPATPVSALESVVDVLDGVLVMTVNPGFAGQKMVDTALDNIAAARAFLDAHGKTDAIVEVDGNVSFENAAKMRAAGANLFVSGSSGVFYGDLSEGIAKMREILK